MKLTFLGATGTVTGSKYLLEAGGRLYDRGAAGGLWLLAAVLAAGIALALRPEFDRGGPRSGLRL